MEREKEIWKPLVYHGMSTYYEVSNYGGLKSLERIVNDKNLIGGASYKKIKEKILKPTVTEKGYLRYTLRINNKEYHVMAHVLTCDVWNGNPLNLPEVHHENYNKKDNYYKNLMRVTRSYNMKDAYAHGKSNLKSGSEHHAAHPVGRYLNGELVKAYPFMDAVKEDGFLPSLVSRAISKNMNHKGFKWGSINKDAA